MLSRTASRPALTSSCNVEANVQPPKINDQLYLTSQINDGCIQAFQTSHQLHTE